MCTCNCYFENFYDLRVYKDKSTKIEYYPYIFSKCLNHHPETGFPKKKDVDILIRAIQTGNKKLIEKVPLHLESKRKLVNFIGGLSRNTMGYNPNNFFVNKFYYSDSTKNIFEMMEVYAQCLTRDNTFSQIEDGSDKIKNIISSLNNYSCITSPTVEGKITSKTLFRGNWIDELYGPYVSQFLYLPFKYGNLLIDQKYFIEQDIQNSTNIAKWFDCQNGIETSLNLPLDKDKDKLQYVNSPRILGSLVHNDPLYQVYYNACLIAFQNGIKPTGFDSDVIDSWTSGGGPDVLASVAHVALGALRVAWYHKWNLGLKIRPEVLAQRIELSYSKSEEFVNSVPGLSKIKELSEIGKDILEMIREYNSESGEKNVLLPNMYNECSPTHPSWPAGHAVVAGACCTVIKAMCVTHDKNLNKLPWPEQAKHSVDGDTLVDYEGDTSKMTIVGEINKLASNISLGRDIAGVHYRCDGVAGNLLGEQYAISYLKDKMREYYEVRNGMFDGFILEKFNGSIIKIDKCGVHTLKK